MTTYLGMPSTVGGCRKTKSRAQVGGEVEVVVDESPVQNDGGLVPWLKDQVTINHQPSREMGRQQCNEQSKRRSSHRPSTISKTHRKHQQPLKGEQLICLRSRWLLPVRVRNSTNEWERVGRLNLVSGRLWLKAA
jgi:hypothetical protein